MKYLSMRFTLMLFVAFVIGLLLCSCGSDYKTTLVTPMSSDGSFRYSTKEVWEIPTETLSVINEGDTINTPHTARGYYVSSGYCIVNKIAED